MKAKVDKDTCIGCTLCAETCPEVFKIEDDGKAVAYVAVVPEGLQASCKKAAEECPVSAIIIE